MSREDSKRQLLRHFSFRQLQVARIHVQYLYETCRYAPMRAVVSLLDEALETCRTENRLEGKRSC